MVDTERGLDRAGHLQGGKLPMHQGQGVGVAGVGIIRQLCGDVWWVMSAKFPSGMLDCLVLVPTLLVILVWRIMASLMLRFIVMIMLRKA